MDSNKLSETFLGKKDKQTLTIIYTVILLTCFLYFAGMACGEALFYLLN